LAEPFLFLGANCYGGVAKTRFMRSVLALEAACAARGIGLLPKLGAGEALVSRARAGVLAQFLRGDHTHLLIVDGDIAFAADDVLRLLDAGKDVIGGAPAPGGEGLHAVASVSPGLLLVSRRAARTIADGYPALQATLRDIRGASPDPAPMVFDGIVEPGTGRYLADLDAFCRRWRDLGEEVWADASLPPWR
jgi:hypothetical protein